MFHEKSLDCPAEPGGCSLEERNVCVMAFEWGK